jgi:Tfp pilus assembly protein PilZ
MADRLDNPTNYLTEILKDLKLLASRHLDFLKERGMFIEKAL